MHDAHSTDSVKRGRCDIANNSTIFAELGIPNIGDEVIFVELCAGSGILSKTAEEHGFFAIPIDHDGNRHRAFTIIQLIWQMTRHGHFWITCKRQLVLLHGTWVYLAALAAGPGRYP